MRARDGATRPREDRGPTATGRAEARGLGASDRATADYRYVDLLRTSAPLVLSAEII